MKKSPLVLVSFLGLSLALSGSALAVGWDGFNTPARMFPLCGGTATELAAGADRRCYSLHWDAVLSKLPASLALVSHRAWSDTYWPDYKGGIAYRWQVGKTPWSAARPQTMAKLQAMTPAQLKTLAPSEKFDLYAALKNGTSFAYPLTRKVMGETSSRAQKWEGICHGWSLAALMHAEPGPVTVEAAGVRIEFGAADVKALLDYYYANYPYPAANVHVLEESCEAWRARYGREPRPGDCTFKLNAGSFHVVLLNQLGRFDEGFLIDVDNGLQIWNQPIVGAELAYASVAPAPGAAKSFHVVARVRYVQESDPQWLPVIGTANQKEKTIDYAYTVDVDATGEIVGGTWDAGSKVPDFLWRKPRAAFVAAPGLGADFSLLGDLLPASP